MAFFVSCVVPAYNAEHYLREALESVLRQTRPPDEIIVVDNGSTDGTLALLQSIPNVLVLHQPIRGPGATRNLGIQASQGKMLTFLDADDKWHPEKIDRQLDVFRATPDTKLCVAHIQNFWSPEIDPPEHDARLLQPWRGYTFSSLMVQRDVFKQIGLLDEKLMVGEDGDWFLRFRNSGLPHKLLPEVLSYRRLHDENTSRLMAAESRDAMLRRFKNQLDQHKSEQ